MHSCSPSLIYTVLTFSSPGPLYYFLKGLSVPLAMWDFLIECTRCSKPSHSSTPVAAVELRPPCCRITAAPSLKPLFWAQPLWLRWPGLVSCGYPKGFLLFLNAICSFMLRTLIISCL